MTLLFCGLPCSGKTTIGRLVAQSLERPFFDSDHLIEEAYWKQKGERKSCREIYLKEKKTFFRNLEREQLMMVESKKASVFSLGGGALEDDTVCSTIESIGLLVYLKTPLDLIWNRLQERGMPAYLDSIHPKEHFYEMAAKRMLTFEKRANVIVETSGLAKEEIAKQILKHERVKDGKQLLW